MCKLGINIDHVATLRNARGGLHPNPLIVAKEAISFGADSITIHLREDRRHIKDIDLKKLSNTRIPLNLEIACNYKMLNIALKNNPKFVCLVPEKRKEVKNVKGRVDLIACFGDFLGIIDFKRSAAGKPSKKDFFEFKNVQIWFYLSNFRFDLKNISVLGFLNLDDLNDSLIFYRPEIIDRDMLKSMKPFLSMVNAKILEYDLEEKVIEFINFEKELMTKACSEIDFFASPRVKKICSYCDYKNVCDKNEGSVYEVS